MSNLRRRTMDGWHNRSSRSERLGEGSVDTGSGSRLGTLSGVRSPDAERSDGHQRVGTRSSALRSGPGDAQERAGRSMAEQVSGTAGCGALEPLSNAGAGPQTFTCQMGGETFDLTVYSSAASLEQSSSDLVSSDTAHVESSNVLITCSSCSGAASPGALEPFTRSNGSNQVTTGGDSQ